MLSRRRTPVVVLGLSLVVGGLAAPAVAQPSPNTEVPSSLTHAPGGTSAHAVDPSVTSLAIRPTITAAAATRAAPTATVTAPIGSRTFQTVGVTWKRGSASGAVAVRVRTHGAKGWTAWQPLDVDEDTLTDAAESSNRAADVRDGTASLYVGPSDGAQAEVTLNTAKAKRFPSDLQFELVDGGTSGHDADASADTTLSALAASSGVAKPKVYSRAEWGADEKLVKDSPTYMSTVRAAVLHHTAGPNGYSKAEVPSIIRGDYAYHVKTRGWTDIGYNALIDRFGRIWEGRAGGLDKNVMGAHAGGFNTDTFGVAAIGSYQYAHPSNALITSAGKLFAWKLDLNHRNPRGTTRLTSSGGGTARYRAGTTHTFNTISGHRNTGYTECPGGNLYAKLGSVRKVAYDAVKAELIDPGLSVNSVATGKGASVTATALRAQSWKLTVTAPCGAGTVDTVTGKTSAGKKITATWDGKTSGGAVAPAGRYTLTLTSSSSRGAARPVTRSLLVTPPALTPETPNTPLTGTGGYVPLSTPVKIFDSTASGKQPAGPNGRVAFPVLGQGGVPGSGVSAVVLNLTATCVSDDTSLTVWPTGGPRSSLALQGANAGTTRSALVTVPVGATGQVSVGNLTGVTQLRADVVGYYAVGGGAPLRAVTATRIYSSGADPLDDDETRTVTLPATVGGVASSAVSAVLVDVGGSTTDAQGRGTLTAHKVGTSPVRGTQFSGKWADNLAVVPVVNGQFALTATGGPVNAYLDLEGVVVSPATGGQRLTSLTPKRLLSANVPARATRKVVVTGGTTGVPANATAVLVQVSGVAPAKNTTLRAYGFGAADPGAVVGVRLPKGQTRGNLALVPVGSGAITVAASSGGVDARVDVYGYLS
ncbi:N-acetylmuramoyl-L-alanine amidase [Spongisporangium articulatum]|uniref:N-acetylmuramoyl-L-alanine amidase n=1 Tax=Spongisporangium articulatum TaxID=3362603 RepID=A0ABW8APV9_9ACTN